MTEQYQENFENEDDIYINEPGEGYDISKDFTTLYAWQKAQEVKIFFYEVVIPKLPVEEKYSLNNQIRKASISITANIAEGYGRYYYQEGMQFYRIARGSLYELKDHLISCLKLKYIPEESYTQGMNLLESAKRTLNGFINFVKKQKSK